MDEVSGHGALLAMEKDGAAAGTFTNIAKLLSDIEVTLTRPVTRLAPHNDTIGSSLVGVMQVESITFSGAFIRAHGTHDHLTGLQKRYQDGDVFGMLFKGPAWSAGNDEIVMSGALSSFKRMAPNSEGAYTFEAVFEPSGPVKVEGVTYGAIGA